MTSLNNKRLLTPPEIDEKIYPYRRVWLSVSIEVFVLFVLAIALSIIEIFFDIPIANWQFINISYAILPILLWVALSFIPEYFADVRRPHLLSMLILSMLVANAIGYPLIDQLLRTEDWISKTGLFERIIVLTLASGITHETLKYAIIRYTVWGDSLETRYDSLAYAMTIGLGYATVFNLHTITNNTLTPDIASMSTFSTLAQNYIGSMLVSYAIAETRFSTPTLFFQTSMILFASVIIGVLSTLSGVLSNTAFRVPISAARSPIELILHGLALASIMWVVAFILKAAERRAQEAKPLDDL